MMCVEVLVVLNAAWGSPRPSARVAAFWNVRLGGEGDLAVLGPAAGDAGVPGLAGGDHGVELSQDRGGDHGLRLGGLQPVGVPVVRCRYRLA